MLQGLIIEDAEDCRLIVRHAMNNVMIRWKEASTAQQALDRLQANEEFQLIVLDLNLPDGDGLQLLEKLKKNQRHSETPVFLYTADNELVSKVTAFNLGADDYLHKSMSPVEIRSRIEARLKKSLSPTLHLLKKGDLMIDIPMMKVSIMENGEPLTLSLTAKEFKLLIQMAQNEGRIFDREDLINTIWGKDVHVLGRTVDSHICGLRKKLKWLGKCIESVPGRGYRFMIQSNSEFATVSL